MGSCIEFNLSAAGKNILYRSLFRLSCIVHSDERERQIDSKREIEREREREKCWNTSAA